MSPKFKEQNGFVFKIFSNEEARIHIHIIKAEKEASISDALNVQMCGRNAIEWPNLDVDLEIESLKHPERYPLIMKRNELDNCQ